MLGAMQSCAQRHVDRSVLQGQKGEVPVATEDAGQAATAVLGQSAAAGLGPVVQLQ